MEVVKEVCERVTLLEGGIVKAGRKGRRFILKSRTFIKEIPWR